MLNPFPIPLNALRAIDLVARHGALAPAAAELGVTIGAVSQHLRRAEERLALQLFERTPKGLVPTPALVVQMPALQAGFQTLAAAAAGLASHDEGVLTLTVGSVFASRWLVWRLNRFTSAHPELEVRLVATGKILDIDRSDIDCAIRFGAGRWPDVNAELLGGTTSTLVCNAALAGRLTHPADLSSVPVIHDLATMLSWENWFAAAGIVPMPQLSGPTYSDAALAFDAAVAGQGVLLAVEMMTADAVADGRLMRPFATIVESELGYWFATSASRHVRKPAKLFHDWLKAEIAAARP